LSRKVVIDRKVLKFLSELPEKSQRLLKRSAMPLQRILSLAREEIKSCYISNSSSIDCMPADHSPYFIFK
jgi:hypothetical protein